MISSQNKGTFLPWVNSNPRQACHRIGNLSPNHTPWEMGTSVEAPCADKCNYKRLKGKSSETEDIANWSCQEVDYFYFFLQVLGLLFCKHGLAYSNNLCLSLSNHCWPHHQGPWLINYHRIANLGILLFEQLALGAPCHCSLGVACLWSVFLKPRPPCDPESIRVQKGPCIIWIAHQYLAADECGWLILPGWWSVIPNGMF